MKARFCKFPLFFPHCAGSVGAVVLLLFLAGGETWAGESLVLPPLTANSSNPRLPGKFVWADLVTDDVPAARKFYAQLFDWKFQVLGQYSIALNDGRPICGLFQRPRPADQTQAKPRWFGYISVPSVKAAEAALKKAGGRVLAASQKMPDRGEQAVFADPEGALFGVIRSRAGDPADFLPEPGDWIWIQLLSRDARKASQFYQAVGGYDVIPNNASNRLSDYVLTSNGFARATVRTIPKPDSHWQPLWLPFVRVTNVDESVARVAQLGGKVWIAPKPELFAGKVAVIADPTGAVLGLLEWSREELKGGG